MEKEDWLPNSALTKAFFGNQKSFIPNRLQFCNFEV
jgi:hypothetical protein